MTRDELRRDNEKTLAICEQVATPTAMILLDWMHEDDLAPEGPTPDLGGRLAGLEETIKTHRVAADALEVHLARMREWAAVQMPFSTAAVKRVDPDSTEGIIQDILRLRR